jgi:hypothetical protein
VHSFAINPSSELGRENAYFHPIFRTVQQDVVQCLLSALDHLRLLVGSLTTQPRPNPFAQSTLIRTSITGAATALWMLRPDDAIERRIRALEFIFKDQKSHLDWITTVRDQPENRSSPDTQAQMDAQISELTRRQKWIVGEANMLLRPDAPLTARTYGQQLTTDTAMIRDAGSATPALTTSDNWDPALTCWPHGGL